MSLAEQMPLDCYSSLAIPYISTPSHSNTSNISLGDDRATSLSPVVPTKKFRTRGGAASRHYSQRQCLITRGGSRNSPANIPVVHHANNSEVNDTHLKILRVKLIWHVVCL